MISYLVLENELTASRARCQRLPRGVRGPSGLTREQVEDNQRTRLLEAMIELVAARGYPATTTRALAAAAAVSKQDMYKLFPNKEAYFLATYDHVVDGALERIGAAYLGEHDWQARLRAAFAAFAAEVVRSPRAARFVLMEVLAAGPIGIHCLDRTRLTFERLIASSLSASPDGVAPPPPIVKGIVCGIERVTRRHLLSDEVEQLPELADELCTWVLAFRSTSLDRPEGSPRRSVASTAAPRASGPESERLRMLHAAAKIAAAEGYSSLNGARIACDAGVAPETFDAAFVGGVEQCFLDALTRLGLEAFVYSAEQSKRADDRLAGVHHGIAALLGHLARHPVLVQIGFVEVFAVGPSAIERREWLLRQFKELFVKALPAAQRPSELAAEASVGAIWGLIHDRVAHGSTSQLPGMADYATYLALAPAIGAGKAMRVIRADR